MPLSFRAHLRSRAPRHRLLVPALVITLALAVTACVPPPAQSGGGSGGGNDTANQLFSLINQDRAAQGLPALAWNDQLGSLAQTWSEQMSRSGALTHQDLDALQANPFMAAWRSLGENIYMGATDAGSANTTWMNSPGHRANILHGFTDVGIGTTRDSSGILWVVADFGTR